MLQKRLVDAEDLVSIKILAGPKVIDKMRNSVKQPALGSENNILKILLRNLFWPQLGEKFLVATPTTETDVVDFVYPAKNVVKIEPLFQSLDNLLATFEPTYFDTEFDRQSPTIKFIGGSADIIDIVRKTVRAYREFLTLYDYILHTAMQIRVGVVMTRKADFGKVALDSSLAEFIDSTFGVDRVITMNVVIHRPLDVNRLKFI
jgi:hypothetical protein